MAKDNQGVSVALQLFADETINKLTNVVNSLDKINAQIDVLISNTSKATTATSKMSKTAEKTLKNINFNAIVDKVKDITRFMMTMTDGFVDYIEDLNLLKVAFSDTADEAKSFVNEISNITGFDESTLVRMTGTFRQLSSTLGLASQDAYLLSTNLTKMALDVSSLYNLDLETAKYALQGALTAQPRSIKTHTGADVTQDTLQADLARLGIDRKVNSLNQAEKAIITYLSLERQLINSNGDLARTIEQPANMLRIFEEQLKRAGRSIGNLFIPVIKTGIPYLTAFLMVFNEIIEVLMTFLGIDTDSFWAGMENGSNVTDNWSASLDKFNETMKETKLGLRGFDKLNVIKTPSSSSSNNLGLGIDSRILDALKEYDLQLDKVKTKATEIRDKIMEWLGFTKYVDSETGEVNWKLQDGYTNLEKIKDAFIILVSTVASYKILSFLGNIVSALSSENPTIGIVGGVSAIGKLIGTVFGKTGLSTLSTFGLGLGGLVTTAGLVYGALQLISLLDFSPTKSAIDWWNESSPETAERIGTVRTEVENLQSRIDYFTYNGLKMKDEDYNEILNKIISLKDASLTELDDWYTEQLKKLDEAYPTVEDKQRESYKKQKENLQKSYKEQEKVINDYLKEYQDKFKKFYDNDKKISTEERLELLEIQKKIDEWSIDALSTTIEEKEELTKNYLKNETEQYYKNQIEQLESQNKIWKQGISDAKSNFEERKGLLDEFSDDYEEKLLLLEKERDDDILRATLAYEQYYQGWSEANGKIVDFIDKDTGTVFSNMQEKFNGLDGSIQGIVSTLEGTASDSTTRIVSFYKTVGNEIYDSFYQLNYDLEKTGESNANSYWKGLHGTLSKKELKLNLSILDNGNYGEYVPYELKADGGFVDNGQFFVAREAGPELVGSIGRKTAVANNQQIVDAVAQGVSSAMLASGGFKNNFVIEAHGDADGIMNFITFKQKEQDMQYGN